MAPKNQKLQAQKDKSAQKNKPLVVTVSLESIEILQIDILNWRSKVHPRSQLVPMFTPTGTQILQICRPLVVCKGDEINRFYLVAGIRTLQALRECCPSKIRVQAILISRPSVDEHKRIQLLDYCLEQINDASSDQDLALAAKSIIECDKLFSMTKELTGIRNRNELRTLFGIPKSTFHRHVNNLISSGKSEVTNSDMPEEAVNLGLKEGADD